MKVLVATRATQGQRANDACLAEEGELVTFGPECSNVEHGIDSLCPCQRVLLGLFSLNLTTTMQVAERDVTEAGLYRLLAEFYTRCGTSAQVRPKELDALIRQDIAALIYTAEQFQAGDVIERQGDDFLIRQSAVNAVESQHGMKQVPGRGPADGTQAELSAGGASGQA